MLKENNYISHICEHCASSFTSIAGQSLNRYTDALDGYLPIFPSAKRTFRFPFRGRFSIEILRTSVEH